jgi:RND family efflux transporter MFP subunit
MKKRILFGILAMVGLGWGLGIGLPGASAGYPGPTAGPVDARSPTVVRVGVVQREGGSLERRFSGSLRAAERGQLAFTIAGRLDARPVELGDTVAAGDVLARLDRAPLRNRIRAASANLDRARAQLEQATRAHRRAATLHLSEAIATAEVEDAQSNVDVLAANRAATAVELDEARRVLGEATLRAPFPAVVTQVMYEPGEFVPAGVPAIALSGNGALELEVDVSEDLLPDLPVGAAVAVRLPRLLDRTVPARVIAIGRASAERGRLFPVLVRLDASDDLIPGLAAELVVPVPERDGLSVPVEAVINPGGMHPAVFVVRDGGVVDRLEVDVVQVQGGRAVVTGALADGEMVVVGGLSGLVPGEAVAVVQ